MNHSRRIEAVKQRLVDAEQDALVVTGPHDCYYLSGFHTTSHNPVYPVLIIPADGEPLLLVSALDEEVAQREAALPVHVPDNGFSDAVRGHLSDNSNVLVTSTMNVGFYHQLGNEISLQIDDAILTDLRAQKDAAEIRHIKEAYRIAEDAITTTVKQITAGDTEKAVAAQIEYEMRMNGSDGVAFDTIVGTNAFTALPHHATSDTAITEGSLLFDIGSIVNGYRSDISRTFYVGEPTPQFQDVYGTVQDAQQAAADILAPGTSLAEVDAAARSLIEDAGYGDAFIHSTGHGVGIQIHEAPNLSPAAEGELEEGMVVTVEPGIYLRGEFGVRIEDAYYITGDGAERLTTTSRDLQQAKLQ